MHCANNTTHAIHNATAHRKFVGVRQRPKVFNEARAASVPQLLEGSDDVQANDDEHWRGLGGVNAVEHSAVVRQRTAAAQQRVQRLLNRDTGATKSSRSANMRLFIRARSCVYVCVCLCVCVYVCVSVSVCVRSENGSGTHHCVSADLRSVTVVHERVEEDGAQPRHKLRIVGGVG